MVTQSAGIIQLGSAPPQTAAGRRLFSSTRTMSTTVSAIAASARVAPGADRSPRATTARAAMTNSSKARSTRVGAVSLHRSMGSLRLGSGSSTRGVLVLAQAKKGKKKSAPEPAPEPQQEVASAEPKGDGQRAVVVEADLKGLLAGYLKTISRNVRKDAAYPRAARRAAAACRPPCMSGVPYRFWFLLECVISSTRPPRPSPYCNEDLF